ncbi:MAG: tetraprenyl-beta-curcumene synthase family protein [Thermoanaerobacteraceae bacterium]|nr:tetraprenyl-beta-curcumene synthase family protein [Thermoanaerobacteraceae bacterium]
MLSNNIIYESIKIYKFIFRIFPMVDDELKFYINIAENMPDEVLSKQALNSIYTKKFHCQGGSIYSLYPGTDMAKMVHFIVAYQTISDYLDNLCDRAGVYDEMAFKNLHLAMRDALLPDDSYNDYYKYYPYKSDDKYLIRLVNECKKVISCLPSYDVIRDKIIYFSELYSDLQVYKHLSPDIRERKMKEWFSQYTVNYPGISGWEFAAASGSTLGVFVLVAAAFKDELTKREAEKIFNAYLPWICGLHILLDYYVDLFDDIKSHDLNFISYYRDVKESEERLKYFYANSVNYAKTLKYFYFHQMVIDGLLALYLSDPKADIDRHAESTEDIMKFTGRYARDLYHLCKTLRKKGRV